MKAEVVTSGSSMVGKACRACPKRVRAGQVVVWGRLHAEYGDTRHITHADCLRAILDRAPEGQPVDSARHQFAATRAAMSASRNPFAEVGA